MKRFCMVILTCCFFVGFLWTPSARAYELPAVNLGFTSFLDGGPPAGPGLYFSQYIQYYRSDEFKDDNGNDGVLFKPFASDPDVDVWVSMTQFIYQSDQAILFGGKWGLNVMIPYVGLDVDFGSDPSMIHDNGSGIGDILVGPFLQWGPIMGKNGPLFMHRIELSIIFPTGKYDDNRTLNPGSNFFSFNPYWAATLFLTPSWTASTRVHYLWNGKNDDPNEEVPPFSPFFGADDTQAGQAVHLNFSMAYEIIPKLLRVGINGYYLKQITDTEVDGHDVDNTREQVLGIGPGAVIHFNQDNHLFFNAYFETEAENRTEGNRFNLRFVHHF